MKKFLLLSLLIVMQSCSFAQDEVVQTYKMSDIVVFSEKSNFGLKDKNDEIVVPAIYQKLIRLGSTSWIIQKGNRFGIIDINGNILVKPKYRYVDRIFGKYAKLGNDDDYGLYDENGKVIIPAKYSLIEPMFGKIFLTCKKYKYGIVSENGEILLKNEFDDIYMPDTKSIRILYEGEWYQIEKLIDKDIELPDGVKKITIKDEEFKVTHLVANTGWFSGYYALTVSDYALKVLSSISPAYEQTIDELMFSQGADGVFSLIKFTWLPKFPVTYAKKYYQNLVAPNNGLLSNIRSNIKRKIK